MKNPYSFWHKNIQCSVNEIIREQWMNFVMAISFEGGASRRNEASEAIDKNKQVISPLSLLNIDLLHRKIMKWCNEQWENLFGRSEAASG